MVKHKSRDLENRCYRAIPEIRAEFMTALLSGEFDRPDFDVERFMDRMIEIGKKSKRLKEISQKTKKK
jgi:hypothetical protein